MSLLLLRPLGTATPGTATPGTPSPEPSYPGVPTIHARVAWRSSAMSSLDWLGGTSWIDGGTAISATSTWATQTNYTYGGGTAMRCTSTGTATSGVDYPLSDTFEGGITYRFRVALRNSEEVRLRLGTASDYALATATVGAYDWTTVDWTPAANRTSVYASLQCDSATTFRFDHAEVYEAWDDVTLEELRVSRGSRFDGAAEAPGSIDFTILDPDEVYTPRNTASGLYGYVDVGRKVHIRASYQNVLYPLAYGTIDTVTPDPWSRKVVFHAEDGLAELGGYQTSHAFYVQDAYHVARLAALTDEALSAAQLDLATDSLESDTFVNGVDETRNLLDHLQDLNEATGSIHVAVPHVEAVRPWRYTTISRVELTSDRVDRTIADADIKTLSGIDARKESLITRQKVSWLGYEPRPSQVVAYANADNPYWTYADPEYGSSDTPQPEAIYKMRRVWKIERGVNKKGEKWKRRRRVRRLRRVGKRLVDTVLPIDIAAGGSAVTSVDFLMPMADVSVDWDDTADSTSLDLSIEPARLVMTFSASSADSITAITVTASPHRPTDEASYTANTASPVLVRDGGDIDNEHIGSGGQAAGLAEYITWRYGSGRLRPSLVLQHLPSLQISARVGQHLKVSADRWHLSEVPFVVRSLEHEFSAGGYEYLLTLGLEELPSGGHWLRLDGSEGLLSTYGAFNVLAFYGDGFYTGDYADDPWVLAY